MRSVPRKDDASEHVGGRFCSRSRCDICKLLDVDLVFEREEAAGGRLYDGRMLDMLEKRNLSAHTYNEKIAREIYWRIKECYIELLETLDVSIGKRESV